MAHFEVLKLAQLLANALLSCGARDLSILEIGSLQVGHPKTTIRDILFDAGIVDTYTGCDLKDGPGVDIVESGHLLAHPDNSFDIIVCSEVLEHNPYWLQTLTNMRRMLKAGGLVLVTCASDGRLEHGTSRTSPTDSPGSSSLGWNYYRNLSERDILPILHPDSGAYFISIYNPAACDYYFLGSLDPAVHPTVKSSEIVALMQSSIDLVLRGDPLVHPLKRVAILVAYFPVRIILKMFPSSLGQSLSVVYSRLFLVTIRGAFNSNR